MSKNNSWALASGTILENKYQIESVIGSSQFTNTYLVTHLALEKKYVIKEYFPFGTHRQEDGTLGVAKQGGEELVGSSLMDFIQEARVLNRLRHPNIVAVTDVFEDRGTAYFVMPYLGDYTLLDWIKDHPEPSLDDLCRVFIPLLEGIKYIHNHGLSHADIRPNNVLITDDGMPVLIDFSSARSRYPYVSFDPELPLSLIPDPISDIYGLCACMYEAIMGEPESLSYEPFDKPVVKLAQDDGLLEKYPAYFLQAIDEVLSGDAKDCQQDASSLQHQLLNYTGPKKKPRWGLYAVVALLLVSVSGTYFYVSHQYNSSSRVILNASFDYQAALPVHGSRWAAVEMAKDKIWIHVLEIDKDKHWKVISSSSEDYTDQPDVLLRNIRHQLFDLGVKQAPYFLTYEKLAGHDAVNKMISQIKFVYGSQELKLSTISDKQAMEYLFNASVPSQYINQSLLVLDMGNESLLILKDKENNHRVYEQIDQKMVRENNLKYAFILNAANMSSGRYQAVRDEKQVPKVIKSLELMPVFVHSNIGAGFLLAQPLKFDNQNPSQSADK